VTSSRESPSVADHSTPRSAVTAVIIFFAAHVALLVGVTTPEFISMKCMMCRPPCHAGADAQSDASAACKAVDGAVDPDIRGMRRWAGATRACSNECA
jgi:hypothetical protein